MTHLRLLGSVDLRGPEERPLLSVLHQPKRLALLAYLAVSAPGGFVRRDTLLGLFWPELDDDHARNALSQALSYLRRSLGRGVIVSRGSEELSVDRSRLRCDAAEFDAAAEAGDLERALDLYRDDLMEGFYVPDAPGFERWLEEERQHLRERAAAAARALSSREEQTGHAGLAVNLARRALTLSTVDPEASLRHLLELLGRTGDRAAALREYDAFAAPLLAEYDVEPSPETQRIAERLRQDVHRAPEPAAVEATAEAGVIAPPVEAASEAGVPAVAPPAGDPSPAPPKSGVDSDGGSDPPLAVARAAARTRRAAMVAGVLLLAILAGFGGWRTRSANDAPLSATRVAVLPFTFHGGADFGYLADGLVDLLSANLSGDGELTAVNPRALLAAAGRSDGRVDVARGTSLARRFGAGHYVLGAVVAAEGRLRITAGLYTVGDDAQDVEEITVEGESSDLFPLVDELTGRLLASRRAGPGARLARTAARTTPSLVALKAYLRGEQAARDGRYADAGAAFGEAVAADSAFALAHYRLSVAGWWTGREAQSRSAARTALRHRDRLSAPERQLVSAWERYVSGDPLNAEWLYRAVLERQPDHVEAWYQLAEVLFHWGAGFGLPAGDSKPAFERVLAFEPDHVGALIHLARTAALEGDDRRLDSLTERALRLDPAPAEALGLEALRAFALRDSSGMERLLADLVEADDVMLADVADVVAAHAYNPAGAIRLARLLTEPRRDADQRGVAHILIAQLELARGRWSAAKRELDSVEVTEPAWARQYRAAYAAFPLLDRPASELEEIRAGLSPVPPERQTAGGPQRHILPPRRHYLTALVSLRLDDPLTAIEHAVRLEGIHTSAVDQRFGQTFARVIRAMLAQARGDEREALDLLGPPSQPADSLLPHISSFPHADARWLRAELMQALGRDDEALRWYATFPDRSAYDLIYLAPSHLRRAEIHERSGDRRSAALHYERFIDLWRDADPELQPLVDDAARRLEELIRAGADG